MSYRRVGRARRERAGLAIAAILALVLVHCAAWARSLSDQEKAALAATVDRFGAAVREGNHARMIQTMPPKVIAAMSRRLATTPEQIVALMVKAMQQGAEGNATKIESFRMDLGTAAYKELASGAPYVLVPTQAIIVVGGQRTRERSHTLALLDDGQWFLLRVNNASWRQFLLNAYPEFASVEFPSGSTEALKP